MDVALPAYLSSHMLITQLLPHCLHGESGINDTTFIAAVSDWQARVMDSTVAQQLFPTKEKFWEKSLVRSQELSVLSAAPDQAGRTRLSVAAAPHSGAFLHARLCSSRRTRLDNSSLCIAIALCLRAPVFLPHTCVCRVGRFRLSHILCIRQYPESSKQKSGN